MSLKENIDMVKEELNSEEKFFESAVKVERFVKKYRNAMIGAVSAIVVLVIANTLYEADKASTAEAANKAYATLLKNSDDKVAQAELQKLNSDLYDIWMLSVAVSGKDEAALSKLTTSKAPVVADIASYELAAISQDPAKLDSYSLRQQAVYKDMAAVEDAMLLLKEKKIDAAHSKLAMVAADSPLYQIAQLLLHYGVK